MTASDDPKAGSKAWSPEGAPNLWLHRAWFRLLAGLAGERQQWVLWLPVGIAVGIGVYFALPFEPTLWWGVALLLGSCLGLLATIKRPALLFIFIAVASIGLGFAAAQWRTASVAQPILQKSIGPLRLSGTVIAVQLRDSAVRVVLQDLNIPRLEPIDTPAKVRIRLSQQNYADVQLGQRITLLAKLRPPPEPAAPGAYDFARRAYFQGLGVVGFAFGQVEWLSEPALDRGRSWSLWWESLRQKVAARVLAVLPEPIGGVAVALIVGDRGAIPESVLEDMRASGLAHLLAISGLHMGLVAGLLYGGARFLLALVPWFALRFPIKKWAAIAAFCGALFYLFLAAAPIPTQRAFIMVSVVLLAVLLDRRAISLRTVAWAAIAVLLLTPESLLSASFQMSFAAVTALVAGWEALGQSRAGRSTLLSLGERHWAWRLLAYFLGVSLTSVIAILATAPFAAYHFNRLALFGLLANLIAVPIMACWIMPMAILSLVLMPLGLEGLPLSAMGWGLEIVLWSAAVVAKLPGALLQVGSVPFPAFLALVLGGLWLCLWRRPWRLWGLSGLVIALPLILLSRPPDILVAGEGGLMGIRDQHGTLLLSSLQRQRFTGDVWLRRLGGARARSWEGEAARTIGLRCDTLGCFYSTGGQAIALLQNPLAYAEDCRRADLLISLEPVPKRRCGGPAQIIDHFDLWRYGGHVIWLTGDGFWVETVAEFRGQRPWVRRRGGRQ